MSSLPITAFLGWFPQNSVICLIIHFFKEHPEVPDTTKVVIHDTTNSTGLKYCYLPQSIPSPPVLLSGVGSAMLWG